MKERDYNHFKFISGVNCLCNQGAWRGNECNLFGISFFFFPLNADKETE